jgi:hypothetical protein
MMGGPFPDPHGAARERVRLARWGKKMGFPFILTVDTHARCGYLELRVRGSKGQRVRVGQGTDIS